MSCLAIVLNLSLYITYHISGVSASAIPSLLLEELDNEGEPGKTGISTFAACPFLGERNSNIHPSARYLVKKLKDSSYCNFNCVESV